MQYIITIPIVFLGLICFSQERNVKTKIAAENIFELSIIQVYPDSFPNVSVIFQAKNQFRKPLWLLKKSELKIHENGIECHVLRLINITKNKPLNIGLVVDHSGSMLENPNISRSKMDEISNQYFNGLPIPNDFTSSLDYAKKGILEFLGNSSDSILFVGFSGTVDKVMPLSNNLSGINSFLKGIDPSGGTAFYDALFFAIDNLVPNASNSVIIAMTDGLDNLSTHTYDEVINKAIKNKIPIYIIGLGDVDKQSLKRMSKLTDGFFYQTNDPNKLKEIYASIKEQLKSIYQVDYTSKCIDPISDERIIRFSFLNDTLTFLNSTERYKLPNEALIYLKEQEKNRLRLIERAERENEDLLWSIGSAGGIVLLGFASFIIYKRRKSTKIVLENVYPNPFESEVTIAYILPSTTIKPELSIYHIGGQLMNTFPIDKDVRELIINTSDLIRGVYIFKIADGNNISNALKTVRI